MIMEPNEHFLKAIHEKKVLRVKVNSDEKGIIIIIIIIIIRKCIPFDFGPSRRYKDGLNRYHFWDLDSPEGSHTLSICPEQLLEIEILDEIFNPQDYVTWRSINWFVKRDLGEFS